MWNASKESARDYDKAVATSSPGRVSRRRKWSRCSGAYHSSKGCFTLMLSLLSGYENRAWRRAEHQRKRRIENQRSFLLLIVSVVYKPGSYLHKIWMLHYSHITSLPLMKELTVSLPQHILWAHALASYMFLHPLSPDTPPRDGWKILWTLILPRSDFSCLGCRVLPSQDISQLVLEHACLNFFSLTTWQSSSICLVRSWYTVRWRSCKLLILMIGHGKRPCIRCRRGARTNSVLLIFSD